MLALRASAVALLGLLIVAGTSAQAQVVLPVSPVVNGGFEVFVAGGQVLCNLAGDQEVNLVVAIVDTCSPGAFKALQWSSLDGVNFGNAGADGDADREAIIGNTPDVSNHNFWQAWSNPQQAFGSNYNTLSFRVEEGVVPAGANIQVGFSLVPAHDVHPFVAVFWEGAVMYPASALTVGAGGQVAVNPVANGVVICPGDYDPCLNFKAQYDAATAPGKASLLEQTRMVQLSFWNFNLGAGRVVIDDVAIVGAHLFTDGFL